MAHPWPVVGRDEELAFAAAALRGSGIVIAGPPGVGKSRLSAEVLGVAAADGAPSARVLCTAATAGIPMGALAPLLPALRHAVDPLAAADRLDLLRVLREGVRSLGSERRPVLAVDDAHLLDETGAAAILQLVVAGDAAIVATVRSGEPVPVPVRSLWRDAGCERLELQNLSESDAGELLEAVCGGPVASSTVHRMWKLTAGNPLFLSEVVAEATAHGTLSAPHGVWVWDGSLPADARLQELVTDRLGRLDEDERAAVALVAAGEPLPLELLQRATAPEVFDRLERAQVVVIEARGVPSQLSGPGLARGSVVRLAHPIYGEVLRASDRETAAARRRLMAICGEDPPEELRLPLALWALQLGATLPVPLLLGACADARVRGDDDLAVELAAAAEAAGGGPEATAVRGRALVDADRTEAQAVLTPLLEADDPAVRAQAAAALADLHRFTLGDPESALALLERVVAGLDGPWRDYLEAHRATLLAFGGHARAAAELAVPLLDADDARVRVRAIVPAGMALALGGRGQTALRLIDARTDDTFAMRDTLPLAPAWWFGARLLALLVLGEHRELDGMIEAVNADPASLSHAQRAHLALLRGRALLVQGRPVSAAVWLRDAVSHRQPGGEDARRWAAALLAEALALVGDHDGAAAAWADADLPTVGQVVFHADMVRAGAWVQAGRGELAGARRTVEEAVELAAADDLAAIEINALHDAARLGIPAVSVSSRMDAHAGSVEGPLLGPMVAHAVALAGGDGAALCRAATQLEAAGLLLAAAEAAYAGGDRSGAARLLARCEGARTPALAGAVLDPLTRREREVAELATQGLSSRAIGASLGVSVRTVENHLSRAYSKLGVGGRAELSGALHHAE